MEAALVLLEEYRNDSVVCVFTSDDFDAAAFVAGIMEAEEAVALEEKSGDDEFVEKKTTASTLVRLRHETGRLEAAMEAHTAENRDALLRDAKATSALRRDVEAVEAGTRDFQLRARAFTRKLSDPYEACARRVAKLRTVFEANEILKRCQRFIFGLQRLREKIKDEEMTSDLRELALAAARVKEVEEAMNGKSRKEPSLHCIDALSDDAKWVKKARRLLDAAAARAVDSAVEGANQSDLEAALTVAADLGGYDEALERAVSGLAKKAANVSRNALVSSTRSDLDRSAAKTLADTWANDIEHCALRAAVLDRVLKKRQRLLKKKDKKSAKNLKNKTSVADTVWRRGCVDAVKEALDNALLMVDTIDHQEKAPKEDLAANKNSPEKDDSYHEEEEEKVLAAKTASTRLRFEAAQLQLTAAAKNLFEETTKTSKSFMETTSKSLVAKQALLFGSKNKVTHASKVAASLAKHYPAVRRSFVNMAARVAQTQATESSFASSLSETTSASQAKNMVWNTLEKDPLKAAGRAAPPASFVACCEAQFNEIMSSDRGQEAKYSVSKEETSAIERRATRALEKQAFARRGCTSPTSVFFDLNGAAGYRFDTMLDASVAKHRAYDMFAAIMAPADDDDDFNDDDDDDVTLSPAEEDEEDDSFFDKTKKKKKKQPEKDAFTRRQMALQRSIVAALAPLSETFLAEVQRKLLEPVILMFPEMEGYEVALPSKQDALRFVAIAKTAVKDVIDEEKGDRTSLAFLVLQQLSFACEEFANRATRALMTTNADTSSRYTSFATLTDAVDRAAREAQRNKKTSPSSAEQEQQHPLDVVWRASANDERDAQIATLCATLRSSLKKHLGKLLPSKDDDDDDGDDDDMTRPFAEAVGPGLAALDGVCEKVSFKALDALAFRVETEVCVVEGLVPKFFDYDDETDQRTEALVRCLAALEAGRVGYCAALPSWTNPGNFDSPSCRASLLAMAGRIARSFVNHVALRRPLFDDDQRLAVAADATALDDALAAYEPDTFLGSKQQLTLSSKNKKKTQAPLRFLADEDNALDFLRSSRQELQGLKRFVYASTTSPVSLLAAGADLVAQKLLRPSAVFHHVLAALGPDDLPMPFQVAEKERGGGSALGYVAWLVAGPPEQKDAPQLNTPLDVFDREADAYRDVQRCLDAYADQAAKDGIANLTPVYDALTSHGPSILAAYKRTLEG